MRSGFTLLTEGIVTYSKAATKLSEDQSAPLFAETANATEPTPSNAPAASDGGATHEACVLLEDDAGMEGASPKRQRIVSEKNCPVTETRVLPATGPRDGDTFVIEGAMT